MKIYRGVFYHIGRRFGKFGVLNRRKRKDVENYRYQCDNLLLHFFQQLTSLNVNPTLVV